ncbi:tRNA-dihydrouridine(20a/20b) synthase [NAD(P)+]-like isoform X1 [Ostrinia nubilalis]|uniref:tRNA-dihydrouridine(20a/20b) synthase [NAD(P)+]-like isoform X1 n=2 Tax=Ostrinia nubilalis TaxID=29057 RepID=UPI00308246B7
MKVKKNIVELFDEAKTYNSYVKICAPMVRYSKVQFRTLVKNYGTELTFTPMILADSFCQNSKARTNEFSTTTSDSPLIVQFAANNALDFADASKLIYPYADGVDLNCGCPQKWAMKDGYGCALLSKPNLIFNLVREVKNSLSPNFSISVKIRVLDDLKKTINLCQQLEKCGVTFLTVHGRTPQQKTGDSINVAALEEVCKSVQVPVVANGGIKTLQDADTLYNATKCNGVMAASGILTNPALFSGANRTPLSCVKLWQTLKNKDKQKITFQCYHHHLVFMLEKVLTKQQKLVFNHLSTFEDVDEYINKYLYEPKSDFNYAYDLDDFLVCDFPDEITLKHSHKCRGCSKSVCYCTCSKYDYDATDGSFFTSYIETKDSSDYMDSNIFNEYDSG